MKKYTPTKLVQYLSKEFFYCLFLIFLVFLSLSLLINFTEEMTFFKEKKIDNLIWLVFYLALSKTPNTIIELSIFIFLLAGIFFFVKLQKNKEINTILLSGVSRLLPILVPSITSLFLGIGIILFFSPLSSASLKFYESTKRVYAANENLIVINNAGLWFMEDLPEGYNIIRTDKISDNDFSILNNVTIYNLDKNFNFQKRYDSKRVVIDNKNWLLEDTKVLFQNQNTSEQDKKLFAKINFLSSININDLKEYFSNADTVSFWEIPQTIKSLNDRGYSADELKVKLHKYLSLPLYLFSMILLSTVFTIGINKEYNTTMYIFFGIALGFLIYFLNDLSVAVGLANKLPLTISVWSPIVIIMFLSGINLIRINEK